MPRSTGLSVSAIPAARFSSPQHRNALNHVAITSFGTHGQLFHVRSGHGRLRPLKRSTALRFSFLVMRIVAIVVLLALSAAGQTQQDPKFSANSNLVIVDVTVQDKSGKAIEGLKQAISPSSKTASRKSHGFRVKARRRSHEPPPPFSQRSTHCRNRLPRPSPAEQPRPDQFTISA